MLDEKVTLTDSQIAADHEVPTVKKMLNWLMIWF